MISLLQIRLDMSMWIHSLQKVLAGQGTELKVFIKARIIFLQIDSHTQFLPNWDVLFEEALLKIEAEQINDNYFAKPIITSYPRSFKVLDFDKGLFELNTGDKHTQVITYRKDSLFSRGSFSRQIGIPTKHRTLLMPT